jgi:hypothetical protein
MAHDFGAQYGRTSGGVVSVTSRAGTNQFHGTAFGYGRNDAMTAIDYFTKASGFDNPPYDREQFGGSYGGPIQKDRMFFFGAVERVQENRVLPFSAKAYNEAVTLKQALTSLTTCPGCVTVGNALVPTQAAPQTIRDLTYTAKVDYQLNQQHSLFVRWGQQRINSFNDLIVNTGAPPHPDTDPNGSNVYDTGRGYSFVGSETWVIGNAAVNTFAFQANHLYTSQICHCGTPGPQWATRNLLFPSLQVGVSQNSTDQDFYQDKVQFKDDFSRQIGRHALKVGGDFGFYPKIGVALAGAGGITQGAISFFDDPSVIVNNRTKYPQGFLTPGATSQITVGDIMLGGPAGLADTIGQKQFGVYVQDDWKVKPNLTLNLGVRYDLDLNWYNQKEYANNRTYLVLKAIGSPYGNLPQTPTKDISPRVGFAWDINGDGRSVLRGGFGLFFDQTLMINNFTRALQEKATLGNIAAVFVNSGVGVGQVANYVYATSPLPAGPLPGLTQLRPGASTAGNWFDPDLTDPYNRTVHVGYSRQLTDRTALAADYTHIEGRNQFRNYPVNPIEGAWDPNAASYNTCGAAPGYRRMQCAFQTVLGDPRILGGVTIAATDNSSRYDELIIHLENRYTRATFQASYTLSGAYGYGGAIAGAVGGQGPQAPINTDQHFGPGEWGPTPTDERHRVVVSGVFALVAGIQVSPIFQIASARPYNLTAGRDLNGDGTNNERYIDPGTGQMLSVNAGRGTATWNFDTRVTKFFNLGSEAQKLGVFAEFYNITNKANFGNAYNGNSLAATFRQPTGFINGGYAYPTSRQLQLGARFTF